MRQRDLMMGLALGAVLAIAETGVMAQSPSGNHPLAGTWSGYIGRSEASPSAAKFEFKLAADGAVSGTVTGPQLSPGEIRNVAFDRATGSLKFTVSVREASNGGAGNVSFDGHVAGDTASGKIMLGSETGVFRFMKQSAVGQQAGAALATGEASATVRRGFTEVSGWITRAAELVPADKYSYRPAASVRTYGEMVAHIIDGSRYYCGRGAGRSVQWTDAAEKGPLSKAALTQALRQAFAECASIYSSEGQIAPLMENIAHSSLHYGNLVTYIRMLGLVPPSS